MKQIMEEYGGAIIEAIATVALLGLFTSLVFTPGSLLSQKLLSYAAGYAGESKAADAVSAGEMVESARGSLPEPVAVKSVFAKRQYDVSDIFQIPEGYTLRITRGALLDDLSGIESAAGRGNMATAALCEDGRDITGDICSCGGKKLTFPSAGYYALMAASADGNGRSVTGVYLVSVRE